jgi:putative phosphoesterase
MLVGILSESHGDAEATARAIAILERRGAQKLFHCGDICGEHVLAELAGHDCTFVWGNCDSPAPSMRGYVASLGLSWPTHPVRVELCGKRIGLYHGHEREFRAAMDEPGLDYIFFGHTHECCDRRDNGRRLINPGALQGRGARTIATLDLATEVVQFLSAETGAEVRRCGA